MLQSHNKWKGGSINHQFAALLLGLSFVNSGLFGQNSSQTGEGVNFMKESHTIVEKADIFVMGISCRTSNAQDEGPQDIPRLWEKFYKEAIINQIPNRTSDEVIALYCDYEGDHTKPYRLVIGCPVSSIDVIPEGMVAKTIPGSHYAVFSAVGEYPQSLIKTWGDIWQEPDLNRTYTGDYELYGEKFPKEVEVYIAVSQDL